MTSSVAGPADVLAFWRAAGSDRWFKKDAAFDAEIVARFSETQRSAAVGTLSDWANTPAGALALLNVLDHFPRNMFRGDARAFATDAEARAVANRAIAHGFDQAVPAAERLFFYLPFEHSEDLADQERGGALMQATGDADLVKWAKLHSDIIRCFGRFPHRNVVLGRATTPEQQAFLDSGGFAG